MKYFFGTEAVGTGAVEVRYLVQYYYYYYYYYYYSYYFIY